MDSIQITRALKRDPMTRRAFIGVFACDKLPKTISKYPACLVVNTDFYGNEGKHWLAMYIPDPGTLEFFDSFGRSPTFFKGHIVRFVSKFPYVIHNDVPLQSLFSTVCGQFCIFYLYCKCRGRTMKSIVNNFHWNSRTNDVRVYNFVKHKFGIHVSFDIFL